MLDLDTKIGDGVEEPVEDQGGGNEEGIALALHDGLLVAEILRRGARLFLATRPSLVLPVDIHQQEEAERHHRQEGLEQISGHGDQALAEAVKARDSEEEHHDGLSGGGVAQHNPFKRHRRSDFSLSHRSVIRERFSVEAMLFYRNK